MYRGSDSKRAVLGKYKIYIGSVLHLPTRTPNPPPRPPQTPPT